MGAPCSAEQRAAATPTPIAGLNPPKVDCAGMRAATVEELAKDPVGRYVTGRTFVHFCVEPELWGVLLWGRPSETDAITLGRSLVLELTAPAQPHMSIIDASRIEGADEGAFGGMQRYIARYSPELSTWVKRLGLVRPEGLRGAIVAGAYEVMGKPYPVAVFDGLGLALDWLGKSAAAAEVIALTTEALGTTPLLDALRAYLDVHLEDASLREAAQAMGLSDRSLQRKLADAGAAFQDELGDARVRAAQRRLLDGHAALTTVALEVGCASLQHFNTLFRRRTGMSPSAWREQQRVNRA